MKKLVLIRHGKSSWSDADLTDYDRPLNKRGKKDVPFMAKRLADKELLPDMFVSSKAKRAKSTAKKIAGQINFPKKQIVLLKDLYLACDNDMLDIVRDTDNQVETLFLVGHNYGITDLASRLSGKLFDNIPTAGIVGFSFMTPWEVIKDGEGKLLFFEYPKLFTPMNIDGFCK